MGPGCQSLFIIKTTDCKSALWQNKPKSVQLVGNIMESTWKPQKPTSIHSHKYFFCKFSEIGSKTLGDKNYTKQLITVERGHLYILTVGHNKQLGQKHGINMFYRTLLHFQYTAIHICYSSGGRGELNKKILLQQVTIYRKLFTQKI